MVSIIVLSLDPPESLLKDLSEQTYQDFEIIIAREKGIVKAMNKALEKAKGEILVRIDDDVLLPKDWLQQIVDSFTDYTIAGVTGPTYVPYKLRQNRDSIRFIDKHQNNPLLKWLFDDSIMSPAKIYKCGSVSYGSNFCEHIWNIDYDIDHLEGTNWAVRTELIRKVGGFDESFDGVSEWFDDDCLFKIKKLGYKLKYNPKAFLYHMLGKSSTYSERFSGISRLKNWLRFHKRHSKFHYKKVIWFLIMCSYFIRRKNG